VIEHHYSQPRLTQALTAALLVLFIPLAAIGPFPFLLVVAAFAVMFVIFSTRLTTNATGLCVGIPWAGATIVRASSNEVEWATDRRRDLRIRTSRSRRTRFVRLDQFGLDQSNDELRADFEQWAPHLLIPQDQR